MENLWPGYIPHPSKPSSLEGACLPQDHGNVGTAEDVQIRTPIKSVNFGDPGGCTDVGNPAATLFDAFPSKSPHDYGMLGTASSGPLMKLGQTDDEDSSSPMSQCWQKFVGNFGDQGPTLTCNSRPDSLMNSRNPLLRPTRNRRWKKAAGGGGRHAHVHKLVERQAEYDEDALFNAHIATPRRVSQEKIQVIGPTAGSR